MILLRTLQEGDIDIDILIKYLLKFTMLCINISRLLVNKHCSCSVNAGFTACIFVIALLGNIEEEKMPPRLNTNVLH